MLRVIGIDRVEELFADVPADARFPVLDLPPALSELEASRYMSALAAQNVSVKEWPCFIGGGAYNHYSPAAVGHIMGQPQFYTAYTPYQPEVSQGTLQVSFEFQSLVCELLGLDVANDSVYDGASAVGEAVLMAQRLTRRERVVLSGSLHPQWREVVQSYVAARDVDIVSGHIDLDQNQVREQRVLDLVDEHTACVVVQQPDVFGHVRDFNGLAEAVHERGALLIIAVADATSLGLLKSPGAWGADIATAEGQSLGLPLQYGGPWAGLMACKAEYVRQLPGRISGQTTDHAGRRADGSERVTAPLSTQPTVLSTGLQPEPLLSELSRPGAPGHQLPELDVPEVDDLGGQVLRSELRLPEVGELDVIRHFTHLAQRNFSIDSVFYPLGSCTMKYNPRVNEDVARLPGIAHVHPLQPDETVQGALRIMYELQQLLAEITGFRAATLQPAAGAQGELAGMLMMRAYHLNRGDTQRRKVLVPDSAHGTNPATAAMCGFHTVSIPSDANGDIDLAKLEAELDDTVVGLMLTNPNTLGLFEKQLREVTDAVHRAGGLVYGDGANLNAILGVVKPAEMGFDCVHINVHKTFSTPHGTGGPGAGPVVVSSALEPFLPAPVVRHQDGKYVLDFDRPRSIGRLSYHGHFG